MAAMPSAQNIPPNDTGGMPSSCFTVAAPTKCCAIILEGFFVKTKIQIPNYKYQMNVKIQMSKECQISKYQKLFLLIKNFVIWNLDFL